MFVRHRWPYGFHWWLFSWFAREDAAADDECGHDCPESPKRYLLHCGVLCRSTPPRAIISSTTYLVLRNSSAAWRYSPRSVARFDSRLGAFAIGIIPVWLGTF